MSLQWKFLVDWDGLGCLNLGSFETGSIAPWSGVGAFPQPIPTPDQTHSLDGSWAMKVTYPNTAGIKGVWITDVSGFTVGRSYTLTAWVWVPSASSPQNVGIAGIGVGAPSTVFNDWQLISFTFTATLTTHAVVVGWPFTTQPDMAVAWVDRIRLFGAGADVTSRVLAREPVTMSYGRDQARALNPVGPAEASLLLDNRSRDYSPENASSPLAGFILPSRDLLVEAIYGGKAYTLFRGRTDNYDLRPDPSERAVPISAVDALAGVRGEDISTDLHVAITTGGAIHAILDAIGWPTYARDIDNGVTTIPYWWEEGTDAGSAIEKVIDSEGPPATAYVSSSGDFVFRDRHHRLTRTASLVSQATFSALAEPAFSPPLGYDQGWRDVINSVTFSVEERGPAPELEAVWTSDDIYSIADGETLIIRAEPGDPVLGAVVPVAGTDFRLRSGTVTVSLSRQTGASITIFIRATGGPALLDQLQLRAYPLQVVATRQIHAEDAVSIRKYQRRSYPNDAPWANVHDATAIAEIVLAQRAERLPIASVHLVSSEAQPLRLVQQLSRDLSDRITIVDPETGLSDAFYIDRIEHTVSEGGLVLDTVFGCEKVPAQPTTQFRFDVAGRGFNDGLFASVGLDEAATMFRFDTPGQGFDDGILAH